MITIRTTPVGWLALGCIVMIVIMNGKPDFSNASRPARGIASPVVALQMARSVDEVDDVIADAPGPDREAMRFKQYLDFAFIAFYASLYVALAAMFRSRFGVAAAAFGVAAAVFDAIENFAILRIVDVPLRQTTLPMIEAIRRASLAKWTLAFIATAIFGVLFLMSEKSMNKLGWCMRAIGALNLAAAALGFYGLYNNAFLVWAGLPLLAGLIGMIGVSFRFR
jgi:hypothetical protein